MSEWRQRFHRFTSSWNSLAVGSLCEKLSRSYFPLTGYFAVNACHLSNVGKARAGYHFSSEIIIYPYLVEVFVHFVKRIFHVPFSHRRFQFSAKPFPSFLSVLFDSICATDGFPNENEPWAILMIFFVSLLSHLFLYLSQEILLYRAIELGTWSWTKLNV